MDLHKILNMTGKLLSFHLKSPCVALLVRVPQFENHCYISFTPSWPPPFTTKLRPWECEYRGDAYEACDW